MKALRRNARCSHFSYFKQTSRLFSNESKYADFTQKFDEDALREPIIQDNQIMIDRMSEYEQNNVMGLKEYEQAVKHMYVQNYGEAAAYFKECLRILKKDNQEKTLSYLYVLKRLAYSTYKEHKYDESEKYFKVCNQLSQIVTKNPANHFSAQKNLLIYYTYTNLDKALDLGNRLMADIDDTLPVYSKELCFLTGKHSKIKSKLIALRYDTQSLIQILAYTLNNLACTSWFHIKEVSKTKTIPEMTKEKESALQDSKHIVSNFKDCIEILEDLHHDKNSLKRSVDELQLLQSLVSKDHTIPKDYSFDNEELYFTLLKSKEEGKALSNISEYLLETESFKGDSRNAGFWFRLGMKYFETIDPQHMDRHLILLGLFYASNGKLVTAQDIYSQALDKMRDDVSYTKVMGMNLYGRMLMKNKETQEEAGKYLRLSEKAGAMLPYWYYKIEQLYIPEFDLE
eukprot:403360823